MALKPGTNTDPLWRDEFSVHAEDEKFVTRRQFAKFLTLTSVAMAAGNVWILAKSLVYRTPVYPLRAVASLGEIPVGGVKLFNYPTAADPCIMIRTADDTYVAYSQICTHLSCAVFYSATSKNIECPCHRGVFAADTGAVLAGPPPRPLPRVVLERRGSDLVATGMAVL
jgi:nitrite reductase/ring-hydroxylating ferredoxin subunit